MKNKSTKMFKNFTYLLSFFLKYGKTFFIFIIFTCLFTPLFTVLDIYLLKFSLASVDNPLYEVIIGVSLILGLMLFINFVSNLIEIYFGEKLIVKIRSNINKEIFDKIKFTDFKYFDDSSFYDNYSWTVNQLVNQSHAAARFIWNIISSLITIVSLVILMISMDWIVILFSVISVIIATILSSKITKLHYNKNNESIIYNRGHGYINRLYYLKDYASVIKTTHASEILNKKFDENTGLLVEVANKYRVKLTLLGILEFLNTYIFMGCTIIYLCYRIQNNHGIEIADFAALIVSATTLKNQLTNFLKIIPNFQNISLYGERIYSFFNTISNIENSNNTKQINELPFSVEIKNLRFKYKDVYVLKNININIKKGEKVAIVGENGAGKTTITNLLLRLYDPEEGTICINNTHLTSLDLDSYRNNIGIAFQKSVSFSLTVRENMQFYNDKITDEEINEIFRLVGFDRVMKNGEFTLDSYLTKEFHKDGLELSGGELQLFSICRLFTKEFGLLILDEPSASLDPIVEYNLNNLIINEIKNTTMVLISHRLSNVRKCDKIFFISNGEVLEYGTHDELMNKNGKYCEMFNKQAENYR